MVTLTEYAKDSQTRRQRRCDYDLSHLGTGPDSPLMAKRVKLDDVRSAPKSFAITYLFL